jgi:hypothetical protein
VRPLQANKTLKKLHLKFTLLNFRKKGTYLIGVKLSTTPPHILPFRGIIKSGNN